MGNGFNRAYSCKNLSLSRITRNPWLETLLRLYTFAASAQELTEGLMSHSGMGEIPRL